MGVSGDFLNRILKTGAHELDLRTFRDHGIVDHAVDPPRRTAKHATKRQRVEETRRPLRVGVDVGVLVARASHGFGGMLMDERHLSNMGRALLRQQAEHGEEHQVATALFESSNAETRLAYVQKCAGYVLERIQKLRQNSGAQLLVVLDGATPPVKQRECQDRSERKKTAAVARDEVVEGTSAVAESPQTQATKRMRAAKRAGAGRCHADIVAKVMEGLRDNKIAFLVAPYEADGQLAYFAENGMIDLVVTEDSDLIAHGCRSILYKSLENNTGGKGMLVHRNYLGCMGLKPKTMSLLDFSDVMLAVMFVAVGCDYCTSLKSIGSVAARDIVRDAFLCETRGSSSAPALATVFQRLFKQTSQKNLTADEKATYEESFLSALLMYRHPVVYDPLRGSCVLLRQPGVDVELMDYAPYSELCLNQQRREGVVGSFRGSAVLETHMAEGCISARTMKPYTGVEIPPQLREALPSVELEPIAEERTEARDDKTATEEGLVDLTQGDDPPAGIGSTQDEATQGPPTVHFETQATAMVSSRQNPHGFDSSDDEQLATQVTPLRAIRDSVQASEQSQKSSVPPTASSSSTSKPATQPSQPSLGSQISAEVRSPTLL